MKCLTHLRCNKIPNLKFIGLISKPNSWGPGLVYFYISIILDIEASDILFYFNLLVTHLFNSEWNSELSSIRIWAHESTCSGNSIMLAWSLWPSTLNPWPLGSARERTVDPMTAVVGPKTAAIDPTTAFTGPRPLEIASARDASISVAIGTHLEVSGSIVPYIYTIHIDIYTIRIISLT